MQTVKIFPDQVVGTVKPMHAVNNGPVSGRKTQKRSNFETFKEARIPYSRNHDASFCPTYGGENIVDVHAIFKNFDADPYDPASYDFTLTDLFLENILAAGTKIYYRLGSKIEHCIKKYGTLVPKDFQKWAVICEHIIKHYNEGWADGFHWNIEYWEIWNEPEGHPDGSNCMWLGTQEEYFALYRTAATHLKNCFGDKIKIGGFAATGFSALKYENSQRALQTGNTEGLTDREAIVLHRQTYYLAFLEMLKEHRPPIDFFSWHSYEPFDFNFIQQAYAEETLAEAGYSDIEIHLNEWNTHHSVKEMGTAGAAASSAAMMCAMQETKMTMMNFYDARITTSDYCGLFDSRFRCPMATYDAFLAFGTLYALGAQAEVKGLGEDLYATAATNGKDNAILLANIGEEREVSLNFCGKYFAYAITDDTRMKPASIDPAAFRMAKDTVIFFTTQELTIPQ